MLGQDERIRLYDEHERSMQEEADANRRFNAEWVLKWPKHCTQCHGWGTHHWVESHGMRGPGEPMQEPCGGCTENGICARCGEPGLTSEERGDDSTGEGPCKVCGWNYCDGKRAMY